jgi:hypothetical protein
MTPAIDHNRYDDLSFALAAIDQLAELRTGWDSYDAEPPSPQAQSRAKRCVEQALHTLGWAYRNPIVGATPSGVELIWRGREAEIHALFDAEHDRYVVIGPNRMVLERGSIRDYGFFARNVLKGRLGP